MADGRPPTSQPPPIVPPGPPVQPPAPPAQLIVPPAQPKSSYYTANSASSYATIKLVTLQA